MKRMITLPLMACLLVLNADAATTKNKPAPVRIQSVMLNSFYSGNGLEPGYGLMLSVKKGERLSFAAGPHFTMNEKQFSGIATALRYAFMTEDQSNSGRASLGASLSFSSFSNAAYSKTTIDFEQRLNSGPENNRQPDYQSIRNRAYETAANAMLNYRFDFGLTFQAQAGIGIYNLKQTAGPAVQLNHEMRGAGLNLAFAAGWTFGRKNGSAR